MYKRQVLEAQLAGIAAVKAGVTGKSVHQAAADVISKAGYGAYFGHGFGHSLGIDLNEAMGASLSYDKPLPAGAVISAEPGIYLPDVYKRQPEEKAYICLDKPGVFPYNTERKSDEGEKARRTACRESAGGASRRRTRVILAPELSA